MDEETSDPAQLYADVLVILDRTKGINNSQPSLHAGWMAAVDPRPGETVVRQRDGGLRRGVVLLPGAVVLSHQASAREEAVLG